MLVFVKFTTFAFLSIGILPSSDFWERSSEFWSQSELARMLSNSPWAATRQNITGTALNRGYDPSLPTTATIRLLSALPIREACFRLSRTGNSDVQVMKRLKSLSEISTRDLREMDLSDHVIVTFQYETASYEQSQELRHYLQTATSLRMRFNVYLITESAHKVDLRIFSAKRGWAWR
jgi:hypothetical protein